MVIKSTSFRFIYDYDLFKLVNSQKAKTPAGSVVKIFLELCQIFYPTTIFFCCDLKGRCRFLTDQILPTPTALVQDTFISKYFIRFRLFQQHNIRYYNISKLRISYWLHRNVEFIEVAKGTMDVYVIYFNCENQQLLIFKSLVFDPRAGIKKIFCRKS